MLRKRCTLYWPASGLILRFKYVAGDLRRCSIPLSDTGSAFALHLAVPVLLLDSHLPEASNLLLLLGHTHPNADVTCAAEKFSNLHGCS